MAAVPRTVTMPDGNKALTISKHVGQSGIYGLRHASRRNGLQRLEVLPPARHRSTEIWEGKGKLKRSEQVRIVRA